MLQSQAVTRATLELLKELMLLPDLNHFVLVGGTNLALRFAHRKSIDLDLFSDIPFDTESVFNGLSANYSNIILASQSEKTLFLYINEVKIDVLLLPYPYLQPVETVEGVRLISLPDLAAMKLSAVARRGVKKDFWDIAELLDTFNISEMVEFYKAKYSSHDLFHVLRALVYFEDAENQKDPDPIKKTTWKEVKKKIEKAVKIFIDSKR